MTKSKHEITFKKADKSVKRLFVEAYKKALVRKNILDDVIKGWKKYERSTDGVNIELGNSELLYLSFNLMVATERYDTEQELRRLKSKLHSNTVCLR